MPGDSILTSYPISTLTPQGRPSAAVPVNWPDHVVFLEDYHYHPAIDPMLLDMIRTGAHLHTSERRMKSISFPLPSPTPPPPSSLQAQAQEQSQDLPHLSSSSSSAAALHKEGSKAANDSRMDSQPKAPGNNDHHEDQEEQEEEEEEEEEKEQELSLADEYLQLPLGDAIAGTALGTLHPKTHTPLFEIRAITSPASHPVLGSYGLFACQPLRPGTHLLDYISDVAPDHVANPDSDHTLYLMRDLNLDASFKGNQARFVNDFRGIRSHELGPNLGWDLYCDRRTGQVRMGGKVLKRIRPGEEILCTYGKAFWRSRGIKVQGNEWEDGWDTDLDDWSSSEEEGGEGRSESRVE